MSLRKVVETLYGKLTEGYMSVTMLPSNPNDAPYTKYFSVDEKEQMMACIREWGLTHNTYIGVNPRSEAFSPYRRGKGEDVPCVVGAYQDYDIQGLAHKETRLPETAEALYAFLDSLPVKPTFLVFTGNGAHAYWVFEIPFQIGNQEDRSYIEGILKSWEQYVHNLAYEQHGWVFDSVADLARMLRAVETTNFKTNEKPVCRLVSMTENRCTPEDLQAFCGKISRSIPLAEADTDDFALMGTGSSEELISKCAFLQHCRDEAANLSEPYWFAMISNVAPTADGHEKVHELSEPYLGYTYEETEKKYLAAAKADKPITCDYIKNKLCFNCGKNCGVKAPIALIHGKKSTPSVWDEPIPLDGYQVPAFPVDALPKAIREYVLAVSESTQTPVDLPAVTALAILSICLQAKYVIQPKPDWQEPLNTFQAVFMPPSERKSAVCSAMSKPLNAYEKEWNNAHSAEIEFSKTEKSILERRLKSLEEQASKGKAEMPEVRKASEELSRFKMKKLLRLFYDDVTTEKLASVLSENDGCAAVLSPEGGIFDMLKGMYTRYVNLDVFLKGYSGDPIRVDRIGRESETIYNPSLTVMLMAQPSVLAGVMENDNFRGRGLTARFLYSMPESNVGNRHYRSEPIPTEVYQAYERLIRNLLQDDPEQKPEIIKLSPEADLLLEAFSEELEPKLVDEYSDISDWAGKMVGNIARIAGLLCRAETERYYEFLDIPEPLVVRGEVMQNAISIGRYYIAHAKAAFSLLGADEGIRKCKYVLNAITKAGLAEFTRRDIQRICRSLKNTEQVQAVLNQLEDFGYLAVKDIGNYSGKGRPPASVYIVNPRIYDNH